MTKAYTDTAAQRRTLWSTCAAHILHDGYADLIYILLPVWQVEFGIGYGALAAVRALYIGATAGLQLPVGRMARRLDGRFILALGTALAALGYALVGFSGSLMGLCAALTLSGCGSSTQHPIASAAISRAFGKHSRTPLGIYNFSGDLGKAALPASLPLLMTFMSWRHALWALSAVGMIVAAGLALFAPPMVRTSPVVAAAGEAKAARSGFSLLLLIGVLDTSVRMGLLIFLPFILKAKGASLAMTGVSLALVFIGGAAGKFVCGWLGARLGVVGTVIATESGTAVLILLVMVVPLTAAQFLLPLLGMMLNGTSSVLYGSVPDLSPPHASERAFALFYTGTIGAGATAPVLYGILGDAIGVRAATISTAITAALILPLAIALSPYLEQARARMRSA